jgi:hypothetical protein
LARAGLARITVVKNESGQGFQELVRQHMPCIAPRDAIERKTIDLELAARSSPDDLECLVQARGALAGAPSPASGPSARSAKKDSPKPPPRDTP